MSGDLRQRLARPDLAAADLEGLVRAERFAPTQDQVCSVPVAAIRRIPSAEGEQVDQLLHGERFAMLETKLGPDGETWCWGQARRDGYVGWVAGEALAERLAVPTHRVAALRAYAFAQPSIKAPILGLYSMNALVALDAREGRFAQAAHGGWFVENQLSPIGVFEDDRVAVAARFVGTPYQWGGRESLGLDCSGLVQQSLYACGLSCPRDSDQQALLGHEIGPQDLRRGDLVFWRGHVGIMTDSQSLLHANAHHMAVVIEPLAEAIARTEAAGGGAPTAYRRLAA